MREFDKRPSRSRRTYIKLAGAGLAATVSGCLGGGDGGGGDGNGSPNGTEDPSELPAVHWLTDYSNDAWQTKWNDLTSPFTSEKEIETDIEFVGGQGSGEQRLSNLIQAGDSPDLFTSNPVAVASLFSSGAMEPLDDLLAEITDTNGEVTGKPVLRDAEGTAFQIPHGHYVSTLNYREDIYDALDLSTPSSYEELRENARIIDESDEFDARGIAIPAAKNEPLAAAVFRHFYNNMGYHRFRWKSDAQEEAEVWFPKEPAVEVLNYLKDLAQYSPPPSQTTFASALSDWGGGAYAHLLHLNMWPAGVAGQIDPAVAKNSAPTNLPLGDGVDKEEVPITQTSSIDGHYVLSGGGNTPGAKELLRYMYARDAETTAELYSAEPMRFLPGYGEILQTDTYANFEHFQEFPSHIEKLRTVEQIGQEYFNNVESVNSVMSHGPVMYAGQALLLATMMNEVIVVGRDPGAAVDQYKADVQERLEEGKRRFS